MSTNTIKLKTEMFTIKDVYWCAGSPYDPPSLYFRIINQETGERYSVDAYSSYIDSFSSEYVKEGWIDE